MIFYKIVTKYLLYYFRTPTTTSQSGTLIAQSTVYNRMIISNYLLFSSLLFSSPLFPSSPPFFHLFHSSLLFFFSFFSFHFLMYDILAKQELTRQNELSLIVVPCWWDGSLERLLSPSSLLLISLPSIYFSPSFTSPHAPLFFHHIPLTVLKSFSNNPVSKTRVASLPIRISDHIKFSVWLL